MKKNFLIILSVVVALGLVVAGLIFLRGNEDTWICADGHWVKHGNPSSPKPNGTESCPDNTACTADAKICPDGSAVGRIGVDCEFAECPVATSTTQIANPASVNCEQKGGKVVMQDGPIGQYGLCFFDDNRACEEWAMLRGDCPVGGVKTTGFATEAQKYCAWFGGSTLAVDNAVCIFKDGSKCLDDDFYTGLCQKGSNITSSNLFNLKDVKVGDTITGMVIKSINKFTDKLKPSPNFPLSEKNVSIIFSGQATVTGQYEYTKESAFSGDESLCFKNLNTDSEKLLPKFYSLNSYSSWFCFSNINEAKKKLGITVDGKGMVTIIIDDYVLNSYPSEVFNTARLISLVKNKF